MADKVCEWCGNEFKGRKNARYCSDVHYKTCDNPECDNTFAIKEMKRPAKTCSKACADVLTKIGSTKEKVCQWHNCGKTFTSSKHDAMYCSEKHFDDCVVCGNRFEMINLHKPATTCSKKCAAKITDFTARNKKSETTLMSKYGFKNASQIPAVKEKKKTTTMKNHGVENIFLRSDIQERAILNNGKTISKVNLKWQKKLLETTGILFDLEVRIGQTRSHVDLGYQDLLIDINPSETHNSTFSFPHFTGRCKIENCEKSNHQPKVSDYHQKRAIAAEENGKILLQYFDWYDPEIFINIVKAKLKMSDKKVFARKTVLKEIKQSEANRFLRENHLMGASNGQTLCLGLFDKENTNELIHVQTYGKARLNKNYEWEAIRSCSKIGYHIPGGFSKCDKYFFNKTNPESVISYVDLSISQGHTDSMFDGWELHKTNKSSATWVRIIEDEVLDGNELINNDDVSEEITIEECAQKQKPRFIRDSTARRVSADRLLGFEVGEKYPRFDEDGLKITNDYVLLSEGYVKMFDAGTRTYVWQKSS